MPPSAKRLLVFLLPRLLQSGTSRVDDIAPPILSSSDDRLQRTHQPIPGRLIVTKVGIRLGRRSLPNGTGGLVWDQSKATFRYCHAKPLRVDAVALGHTSRPSFGQLRCLRVMVDGTRTRNVRRKYRVVWIPASASKLNRLLEFRQQRAGVCFDESNSAS
jgi:hypothetical protein